MSKRVWHSGPPPHVGWWQASGMRFTHIWRWWNGAHWSVATLDETSADRAAVLANVKSSYQTEIKWNDYWPENARVPRIDPRQS